MCQSLAYYLNYTIDFFRNENFLDKEFMHSVAEKMECKIFRQNDILMRKGDPGDRMYVLIKGKLGIYIDDSPSGLMRDPIAVVEKYKAVGERALKHKDDRRSATVMCLDVGETICLALEKDDYRKLVYVSIIFKFIFDSDKYKFKKVIDSLSW